MLNCIKTMEFKENKKRKTSKSLTALFLILCMAVLFASPVSAESTAAGNSVNDKTENLSQLYSESDDGNETEEDDEKSTDGIDIDAKDGEQIKKDVSGEIEVEGKNSTGIDAEASGKGSYEVNVTGDVKAEGEAGEGIDAEAVGDGSGEISVGGCVTAEGEGSKGVDIEASDGGQVSVTVGKDVKASGKKSAGIEVNTNKKGKVNVTVKGDVKGGKTGLKVSSKNKKDKVKVVVDGTISGKKHSVTVSGKGVTKALDLTAWKITKDKNGNVVVRSKTGKADREIEKKISYIIKVEQTSGSWISLNGTTEKAGYQTAKEGTLVYLNIDIQTGYKLNCVTNGFGEELPVYTDANGQYYVIVPKGGGVYIRAELIYDIADYSNPDNWAYYSIGKNKAADLFLVCPTVDMDEPGNMSLSDENLKEHFVWALNMERGMYEDSARMFAPYYKQASMQIYALDAYAREQYLQVAYRDVSAAFKYYLENENNGRPIILAGFSQGADMCYRLLEEYFGDEALAEKLVAVYAIGWALTEEMTEQYPQIKAAKSEKDTGTVISFDCEAPDVTSTVINPESQKALSINPLNWKTDGTEADKSENQGACFTGHDGEITEEIKNFCGCYIDETRGALKVPDVDIAEYGATVSVFPEGSFHPHDFHFFYRNLEENVKVRLDAYLAEHNSDKKELKTAA